MVFNDDILFIHVPKTAGMAVSHALLKALPRPVYYAVQAGHEGDVEDVTVIEGRRHQRLVDVDEWFESVGLPHRVATFKHVLVMVRNPYALEVSRYHYLQAGHPWDAGEAQTLALEGDFDAFVRKSRWWFDFADYYSVNGVTPRNLRILRQEGFTIELAARLSDVRVDALEIEELNVSNPKAYAEHMAPELEPLVYAKYQFLFDQGFYSREVFTRKPESEMADASDTAPESAPAIDGDAIDREHDNGGVTIAEPSPPAPESPRVSELESALSPATRQRNH
ncbi:MAG: hypothetical protein AAGG55_14675 [Pseudomonadota bacterium]